jgi:hypothetical protein
VERRSAKEPKETVLKIWFEGQTEDVQAAFLVIMKHLIPLRGNAWGRPYVGQLRRECKGLYEIVVSMPDIEHRPIGYFSGRMEFTFLAFATERDGKLVPNSVCETAHRFIRLIDEGKEHVRVVTF